MSDGGEVSVKFSSREESALWNAFAKLNSEQRKAAAEAGAAELGFGKADRALRKFAEQTKAIHATPLERYNAAMNQLNSALEKGFLSAEEHARAAVAEQKEFEEATNRVDASLERMAAKLREAAASPLERLKDKQDQINNSVKAGLLTEQQAATLRKRSQDEYQRELSETAQAQHRLTTAAVASGTLIAGAWSRVLNVMSRFAAKMDEERTRAVESQQSAGRTAGRLAQIARTPEEMAALVQAGRNLVAQGAVPDMLTAERTVFLAGSMGQLGELPALSKLAEPGVIGNLPEFLEKAQALRTATGGAAGSLSDVIAKAMVAAAPTSVAAESLVVGAATAGSQAQALGVSTEELLPATAIIGMARGSAQEGGTRMAALLRGMENDAGVQGKPLVEMIRTIQARNLSPEQITKDLTAEGADAFRILASNIDALNTTIQATRATDTAKELGRATAIAMGEPAIAADLLARREKASGDLLREAEGRVAVLEEAAIERGISERRTGARPSPALRIASMGLSDLMPERAMSELSAMLFGAVTRTIRLSPMSVQAETIAGSERTPKDIREALAAAISDRDRHRQEAAEQMRRTAEDLSRAARALESVGARRAGVRHDWTGPARREAAVPAE